LSWDDFIGLKGMGNGGFFQNIEQGIFQAQLTSGFEIGERAIGWVFCPG
jgi:hypothetical protein